MSRWRPDARQRLEQAAIELFSSQGFAATTVPQITARAGLTTRTFFRHFADKREVLYGGDEIPEFAARLITDAPASLDPAMLLIGGLQTVAETRFEGRREEIRVRRDIIRSDEGLGERDLRKRADLGEAIRAGFIGRGVDARTAVLLAETAVTVVQVGARGVAGPGRRPDPVRGHAGARSGRCRGRWVPSRPSRPGRRRGSFRCSPTRSARVRWAGLSPALPAGPRGRARGAGGDGRAGAGDGRSRRRGRGSCRCGASPPGSGRWCTAVNETTSGRPKSSKPAAQRPAGGLAGVAVAPGRAGQPPADLDRRA